MGFLHSSVCTATGLNLSTMCREPAFASQSAHEIQRRLTLELSEHELHWQSGSVDTVFYRGQVGNLQLYALRYGAEVEVRPEPFDDFLLVQMPLHRSATFHADGICQRVGAGEVALLSPCFDSRLIWQQGCEQLILKLPRGLVIDAMAQLVEAGELSRDFRLPAVSALPRQVSRRWFSLVAEALQFLPGASAAAGQSRWLRHLEESLPLFLLSHLPHSPLPLEADGGPRPGARQLHKAEAYMREHLNQAVTLQKLASAAGVSVRSLNTLCQREYGQSPMERLRNLRLDAARERLSGDTALSVTQVALDYGFSHTGRFASYYRQRFGELPRATVMGNG